MQLDYKERLIGNDFIIYVLYLFQTTKISKTDLLTLIFFNDGETKNKC
jgi:hypothetical protein